MFQESNYDVLSFQMPPEGMNQFISPEVLPDKFAYYLENILPEPLGSGQVRYGTRKVNQIPEAPGITILESFLYVKQDGGKQEVIYAQGYEEDDSVEDIVIDAQNTLNFTSDNAARYIKDTYIKIEYTLDGANYTFYPVINQVTITDDTDVEIILGQSYFPEGGVLVIQTINYAVGKIYVYDFDTNAFSAVLLSGLSVACIPRSAFFQQTLLICNGVDKVLTWDGDDLEELVDFVKENQAQDFNWVDANNFSFVEGLDFNPAKYFVGNKIQLKINGATNQLTIEAINIVDDLVTITTEEEIPEFVAQDIVELFYRDWPPPFSYIFAGTDRLWALGAGPAGIKWRIGDQALIVYYAYRPNSVTDWFSENNKTVPVIDTLDKHGIADNLEAICQVNGFTAFMGRLRTQLWAGTIPGQGGDFTWVANIDTGVINGNLLVTMPNDVCFISQTGLQTAGTLNVAKQFAATSLNAVDPLITNFIKDITSSDIDYRACRSFKYEQGGFGGFKIGRNKILVSLFQTKFYAWTFFSGDFQKSNTFLDTGNALHLLSGNSIYQYADGNDGSKKLYGDNNGADLISFVWIPKLAMISKGSRKFANKFYQLILSYPSSFPLNPLNRVTLKITPVASRSASGITEICTFQQKGDSFGVPFGDFRLAKDFNHIFKKFKFVSVKFWVMVSGYVINGPISFKQLKLFGIGERKLFGIGERNG